MPNDLHPYFALTGCPSDAPPTVDTLARLQRAHIQAIPFENLNPLTGERVSLDIPTLLDKFTRRRGGYCFEHNTLYRHALQTLGFHTTPLLARVRMTAAEHVVTPRTHMLVLVDLDGERFISDTGFGKMTPTAPLRLVPGIEQPTPHGLYRLVQLGDEYRLEARSEGTWLPLYVFEPRAAFAPDFEMSNWYVSTHPNSHFTRELIAVKTVDEGRHVLHNTRYSFQPTEGEAQRREITDVSEIVGLLEDTFGLAASDVQGLEAKVAGIVG